MPPATFNVKDEWLEELSTKVLDQQEVVTCNWMSNMFDISVPHAQWILAQYYDEHQNSGSITAMYVLTGSMVNTQNMSIRVIKTVQDTELDTEKSSLHHVASVAMYGLSPAISKEDPEGEPVAECAGVETKKDAVQVMKDRFSQLDRTTGLELVMQQDILGDNFRRGKWNGVGTKGIQCDLNAQRMSVDSGAKSADTFASMKSYSRTSSSFPRNGSSGKTSSKPSSRSNGGGISSMFKNAPAPRSNPAKKSSSSCSNPPPPSSTSTSKTELRITNNSWMGDEESSDEDGPKVSKTVKSSGRKRLKQKRVIEDEDEDDEDEDEEHNDDHEDEEAAYEREIEAQRLADQEREKETEKRKRQQPSKKRQEIAVSDSPVKKPKRVQGEESDSDKAEIPSQSTAPKRCVMKTIRRINEDGYMVSEQVWEEVCEEEEEKSVAQPTTTKTLASTSSASTSNRPKAAAEKAASKPAPKPAKAKAKSRGGKDMKQKSMLAFFTRK